MPNPWTGRGNPYSREEVRQRLADSLKRGTALLAAGAGTGISAKFIERGGADLIIIYNSGRFRMSGHGSTAGLMSYGDANAVVLEIGEFQVLPVVQEIPVVCGVHASDPRRRMWHFLLQIREMGFSGVNNFPTHCVIDGYFRQVLEETGMGFDKEVEMIERARRMDLFTIVYVASPGKPGRWRKPERMPSSLTWERRRGAPLELPRLSAPWRKPSIGLRRSSRPPGARAATTFSTSPMAGPSAGPRWCRR